MGYGSCWSSLEGEIFRLRKLCNRSYSGVDMFPGLFVAVFIVGFISGHARRGWNYRACGIRCS